MSLLCYITSSRHDFSRVPCREDASGKSDVQARRLRVPNLVCKAASLGSSLNNQFTPFRRLTASKTLVGSSTLISCSHATPGAATKAPLGAAGCNALQRSDSPHASAARDREVRRTRHAAHRCYGGQRRRETALPARAITTRGQRAPGLCCRCPHPKAKALRHPVDREVCLIPRGAVAGGHGRQGS